MKIFDEKFSGATEVLSVMNMRNSDKMTIDGGVSGRELMRRAGQCIFDSFDWRGDVLIACGSGNNAGDGYVLAALLTKTKARPHILLLEERFSADGRFYFDECMKLGVPCSIYGGGEIKADIIADCIFGTGFHGSAQGKAAEMINAINASGATVVSIDINSGINGDSGEGDIAVRSDLTVSIGSFQPGHFIGRAGELIGKAVNCDIGIKPKDQPFELYKAPCDKLKNELSAAISNGELKLTENDDLPPASAAVTAAKELNAPVYLESGDYFILSDGEKVKFIHK